MSLRLFGHSKCSMKILFIGERCLKFIQFRIVVPCFCCVSKKFKGFSTTFYLKWVLFHLFCSRLFIRSYVAIINSIPICWSTLVIHGNWQIKLCPTNFERWFLAIILISFLNDHLFSITNFTQAKIC